MIWPIAGRGPPVSGISLSFYRWRPKMCWPTPHGRTSVGAPARKESSRLASPLSACGWLTDHRSGDKGQQLAATIKARWVCEQAHQQLKEELGLDHFESPSWQGPLPSCAYDDDRLRLPPASAQQQVGEKNWRATASADFASRPPRHPRTIARPPPRLPRQTNIRCDYRDDLLNLTTEPAATTTENLVA